MSCLWKEYVLFLSFKLCRLRCDGRNFEWLICQRKGFAKKKVYLLLSELSRNVMLKTICVVEDSRPNPNGEKSHTYRKILTSI